MDYEMIKLAMIVFNTAFTIAVWFATSNRDKDKATISSIDRVEENANDKINAVSERIRLLEKSTAKSPTHDDVIRIHERINGVEQCISETNSKLGEIIGEMRHISSSVGRLYQFELEKKT